MQKQNFIKIINPDKAMFLAELGFLYVTEQLNHKVVYCFISNDELLVHLKNNFSKCDFYLDSTLKF